MLTNRILRRVGSLAVLGLLVVSCSSEDGGDDVTSSDSFTFTDFRTDSYVFRLGASETDKDYLLSVRKDFDSGCAFPDGHTGDFRLVGALESSHLEMLTRWPSSFEAYLNDSVNSEEEYAVRDSNGEICTHRDMVTTRVNGQVITLSDSHSNSEATTQFLTEARMLMSDLYELGKPFNESDVTAMERWTGPIP